MILGWITKCCFKSKQFSLLKRRRLLSVVMTFLSSSDVCSSIVWLPSYRWRRDTFSFRLPYLCRRAHCLLLYVYDNCLQWRMESSLSNRISSMEMLQYENNGVLAMGLAHFLLQIEVLSKCSSWAICDSKWSLPCRKIGGDWPQARALTIWNLHGTHQISRNVNKYSHRACRIKHI